MRAVCRNMRPLSHFATQRAPAGNGPARSNPGGEGPHPQPANSQKNPRGTAAATRARGPVSHPAGRRYADPPTGRKGQDDGHEWAEDRAAHSLSVVLFTSRTMVAGVGMRYDGTPVRQPSPGRTGDLSWRGSTRKSGIGGRHGPGTPASGSRPPCPSRGRGRPQVPAVLGHLVADVAVPAHGPIARGGRLMAAHPRFASPSSEGAEICNQESQLVELHGSRGGRSPSHRPCTPPLRCQMYPEEESRSISSLSRSSTWSG